MEVAREVAIPGLNKYIVGRVTKVAKGSPIFNNYVHMTWDNEAAMNRYLKALEERMPFPGDTFMGKVNWDCTCFVEEKVIFENSATLDKKAVATRLAVYTPSEGISSEDIYKFHIDVHAPHIMDIVAKVATPGLKKYVIGRVTDVAVGSQLFTNYVKMWWDDEGALNRYLEALTTAKLPDGTFQSGPQGELGKQTTWHLTAFVDEDVTFEKK